MAAHRYGQTNAKVFEIQPPKDRQVARAQRALVLAWEVGATAPTFEHESYNTRRAAFLIAVGM